MVPAAFAARAGGDPAASRQALDAAEQLRLADTLRFNPWHSLPEHRPLGNQNRARRTIYATLADARQRMNAIPHREPTEQDWLAPGS